MLAQQDLGIAVAVIGIPDPARKRIISYTPKVGEGAFLSDISVEIIREADRKLAAQARTERVIVELVGQVRTGFFGVIIAGLIEVIMWALNVNNGLYTP